MILTTIKLFIIWFVLSDLTNFLGELLATYQLKTKNRLGLIFYNLICYLLTCNKCSSFWGTLIMTGSLFQAAIIAILINISKELIYKYKGKTNLK